MGRRTTVPRDLAVVLVGAAVALAAAFYFDAFEEYGRWAQKYERWQVDEFVVVPVVLAIVLGLFYWSRWRALKDEVAERERAEGALGRSNELLRSVMEGTTDAIFVKDLEGRYLTINRAGAEDLGKTVEEVIGRTDAELFSDDDGREVMRADREIVASGEVRTVEDTKTTAEGETRTYLVTKGPYRDGGGEVAGVFGVSRDITGRKLAEEALRENEERFRYMVQNSSDIVTLVGADGAILYLSPALERVLGYEPGERVGGGVFDLLHPDDAESARGLFAEGLKSPGKPFKIEVRQRHKDGSWRNVEVTGTNLLSDPSAGVAVLNSRDVTERRTLERELERQALHDGLTGLPNRALFSDRLGHALSRAEREGDRVAVLFVDLDNFKYVNDSLGHDAGDRLLVAVAERIASCLRPGDTAARLGGDEFAVLLAGVGGEAERVAGRIVEGMRSPFAVGGGQEVYATPSIGIASGGAGDEPEDLLRRADLAMYRAKGEGKARYEVFEESMETATVERLRLENDLRRALEREELIVRYQPVVRLPTGRVAGFEALVRWEHPDRGLVLPEEFIPVAEETGLIVPVGARVLKEACRQAKEWRARRPDPDDPPPAVGVNLSARQLSHPGLVGDVEAALEESGLEPGRLTLEITESAVVGDAERHTDALRRLGEIGVRLALDDFGTGYSSLAYLRRLPVGMLKIDRSFVERLGQEPEDEVLLEGVVGIAHGLGLLVCAEGVETPGQLERAKALGCDLAQGNLLSGPLTGEEAAAFLAEGPPS